MLSELTALSLIPDWMNIHAKETLKERKEWKTGETEGPVIGAALPNHVSDFPYVASFSNKSVPNATGAETRGRISDFFTL